MKEYQKKRSRENKVDRREAGGWALGLISIV